MDKETVNPSLAQSPRFQELPTRRDFLGLSAIWSALAAFLTALVGSFRLPMPSVFPESNSQAKIGPPGQFPPGSTTLLHQLKAWVHHDSRGLYAISAICTHLGCIATRDGQGAFKCPCHGSLFDEDGKVLGGPAPKGLNWLALSVAPDGQILLDTAKTVPAGTRLTV